MNTSKTRKINIIILTIVFMAVCFLTATYIVSNANNGGSSSDANAMEANTVSTDGETEEAEPVTFELTFNAEESELQTTSKTVTTGQQYGELPVPTKDGYEFVGWFSERAEGTQVTADQIVNNENDNNLYVRWKKTSTDVDKSGNGLPVLMYHQFYDPDQGETQKKGLEDNWMDVTTLETQLKYLGTEGFYFPTWPEVSAYVAGEIDLPPKSVVFTVDDGHGSFYKYAIPLAEKYNVRCTGYIITSWYDFETSENTKYIESELISMQSHTHEMHERNSNGKGYITSWSYDDALADINRTYEILKKKDSFAYPFGHYNDTAIKVLEDAGCKLAFTTQPGRIYPGMDRLTLPRVRVNSNTSFESFKSKVD